MKVFVEVGLFKGNIKLKKINNDDFIFFGFN